MLRHNFHPSKIVGHVWHIGLQTDPLSSLTGLPGRGLAWFRGLFSQGVASVNTV